MAQQLTETTLVLRMRGFFSSKTFVLKCIVSIMVKRNLTMHELKIKKYQYVD